MIRPRTPTRTLLLLLLLATGVGCAREPADTLLTMRGARVSRAEAEREFGRVHPDSSWEGASREQRRAFVELLARRTILVDAARRACPAPDPKRARQNRVMYEKQLLSEFASWRRERFRASPERVAAGMCSLARSARVRVIPVDGRDPAQEISLGLAAGTPPQILAETLLRGLPVGGRTGPIQTSRGSVVLEILALEPVDLATDTLLAARAREAVEYLEYVERSVAYEDSLRRVANVTVHPAGVEVVRLAFQAHWDSIEIARSAGQPIDYQAMRSPVWRVAGEAGDPPLCHLWGRTYSVREFVGTLDDVDLDSWPTVGPTEKITAQVEARVHRLLWVGEAEKLGIAERPEFRERRRRWEESGLLDQYRSVVEAQHRSGPPDSVRVRTDREIDREVERRWREASVRVLEERL